MRKNYFTEWLGNKLTERNIPLIKQILIDGFKDTDDHYSLFYDYFVFSISQNYEISLIELLYQTVEVLEDDSVSYESIYREIFTSVISQLPEDDIPLLVKYMMILYGDVHPYMQNQIEREGWV